MWKEDKKLTLIWDFDENKRVVRTFGDYEYKKSWGGFVIDCLYKFKKFKIFTKKVTFNGKEIEKPIYKLDLTIDKPHEAKKPETDEDVLNFWEMVMGKAICWGKSPSGEDESKLGKIVYIDLSNMQSFKDWNKQFIFSDKDENFKKWQEEKEEKKRKREPTLIGQQKQKYKNWQNEPSLIRGQQHQQH